MNDKLGYKIEFLTDPVYMVLVEMECDICGGIHKAELCGTDKRNWYGKHLCDPEQWYGKHLCDPEQWYGKHLCDPEQWFATEYDFSGKSHLPGGPA